MTQDARHMRACIVLTLVILAAGCDAASPTTVSTPAPPAFRGPWSGNWTKQGCTEAGTFAGTGFCANLTGAGLTLDLTQTGTRVTGTVVINGQPTSCTVLGSCGPVAVNGSIAGDGALTLTGTGLSGNT